MKKLKIYLDTSVISHLKQDDAPDKTADTLKLWEDIKQGKYDVYLSEKTYVEMRKCKQPKQDIMFDFLAQIDFTEIAVNGEIRSVAQQIIDLGILTQKSFDDCIHIASAVVGNCDIIVSWNFQHMVNVKTIRGVRGIANINGYNNIDIMQPTMLISNENEEE